jgi:hypothetical protein
MLESTTDELVPETPLEAAHERKMEGTNSPKRRRFTLPSASKLFSLIYSVLDQGLAVGGGLLANVMLARAQTKEEYGKFVLSYALFSLILGLYQAALLEPYTVYGSGRYREKFTGYSRLMIRSNIVLAAGLTIVLLACCIVLRWIAPQFVTGALWGLALTAGILLSGYLLRRDLNNIFCNRGDRPLGELDIPSPDWLFGFYDSRGRLDLGRLGVRAQNGARKAESLVPRDGTNLLDRALALFTLGSRHRDRVSVHDAGLLLVGGWFLVS